MEGIYASISGYGMFRDISDPIGVLWRKSTNSKTKSPRINVEVSGAGEFLTVYVRVKRPQI